MQNRETLKHQVDHSMNCTDGHILQRPSKQNNNIECMKVTEYATGVHGI